MLLFESFEKQRFKGLTLTPNRFFIYRYARFFPSIFVSYIFAEIILRFIIRRTSLKDTVLCFFDDFWEVLLIKMNGLNCDKAFLNSPAWTMSCIFLVGCIFWCLLYVDKKRFVYLILPVSLIIGFGLSVHLRSGDHKMWIGFTTAGMVRAWLLMGLGYYCRRLGLFIRELNLTRLGIILLTAIELLCHIFASIIMTYHCNNALINFTELLFCIAAAIGFSGQSLLVKLLGSLPVSRSFADASMAIYLVHRPIIGYFAFRFGSPDYYNQKALFLLVLFFGCILFQIATKWFEKLCTHIVKWINNHCFVDK